MNEQRCGLCVAYRKGVCHLVPPSVICAGLIQPTQGLAGIPSRGPQPLMLNARPQVAETDWCAQFRPAMVPTVEELAIGMAMRETAFVPGEGLVTREVPPDAWSSAHGEVTPPAETTE